MVIWCDCGTRNSAFNPACSRCGKPIVEPLREESSNGAEAPGNFAALQEGQTVGGYRLERRVGAGTSGTVFFGRRLDDDMLCAIKVLHPHLMTDAPARARFFREARAFQLVRHHHIARILDVIDLQTTLAIVLEAYEGVSLRTFLERRGTVPEATLIAWLSQIVAALGALHQAGWVHRDIKPENVFLADTRSGDPEVRLLDFGLVRALNSWNTHDLPTAVGAFVGSPAYSAPEQIVGEQVGPFTDFWALGVLAYECVSGKRPFLGATRTAVASAVLADAPAPLATERASLRAWIDDLLQKNAEHRPADWRVLLESLRKMQTESSNA